MSPPEHWKTLFISTELLSNTEVEPGFPTRNGCDSLTPPLLLNTTDRLGQFFTVDLDFLGGEQTHVIAVGQQLSTVDSREPELKQLAKKKGEEEMLHLPVPTHPRECRLPERLPCKKRVLVSSDAHSITVRTSVLMSAFLFKKQVEVGCSPPLWHWELLGVSLQFKPFTV